MLAFLGDTWHDNRIVFFGVLADCFLRKCKCNAFLIAIKLTTTSRLTTLYFHEYGAQHQTYDKMVEFKSYLRPLGDKANASA